MRARWRIILGVIAASGALAAVAGTVEVTLASSAGTDQVVVCKYVGTPGESELVQTGQNPIVVSESALGTDWVPGTFPYPFSDAQGNSLAIRYAANARDGSITECPGYEAPDEVTADVVFRDPTCADPTAGVTYANQDKVVYTIRSGSIAPGAAVQIKAEAKAGYELDGTARFAHTFGDVPENCEPGLIEVTPEVTFVDPTCETDADIVRSKTEGVKWSKVGTVGPGETVTVTATAKEGYVIDGPSVWTHTFGPEPENCGTTTTTPPGPECPPGTVPGGGKDGDEGNDNCVRITTTTETTTTTTVTETTGTTETVSTTETTPTETFEPPTVPAAPTAKPKPAAKPAKPVAAAAGAEKSVFQPPSLAYTP